jgi:hypothetical protein
MMLNHLHNYTIEQHVTRNTALPNTELEMPSDEFLEISKRLHSNAIDQLSADEKYLMARVDSLPSLLKRKKSK